MAQSRKAVYLSKRRSSVAMAASAEPESNEMPFALKDSAKKALKQIGSNIASIAEDVGQDHRQARSDLNEAMRGLKAIKDNLSKYDF